MPTYYTKEAYDEAYRLQRLAIKKLPRGRQMLAMAEWEKTNKPPRDDRAYTSNPAHNSHTFTGTSHHLHQGDLR